MVENEYKHPDTFIKNAKLSDYAMKVESAFVDGTYHAECTVYIKDGFARIVGNINIDSYPKIHSTVIEND